MSHLALFLLHHHRHQYQQHQVEWLVIDGIGFVHPGYEIKVEVECISFSDFVNQFNDDDEIICKMDIEGSEFEVLRDMLNKGSIKKIKDLYVEFNERFMPRENEDTKNYLINEIKSQGVNVYTWF